MPEPIPTPIVVRMTKPTDTHGAPGELQSGPYHDTESTTYEISPIKITVTRKHESSHVPPPEKPCGCGGGANIGDIIEMLGKAAFTSATQPPADDGHEH